MNTEELIDRLAGDAPAVRRLQPPWQRAALWALGAGIYFGVLAVAMAGANPGAGVGRLFMIQQLAALTTAVAAAAAACASVVPGMPTRALRVSIVSGLIWAGAMVAGSLREPDGALTAALMARGEWMCVGMIVFGGVVPGIALLHLLRRGMALRPRLTATLGLVAVAALANVSACLSQPHASSAATLLWHGATMLLLVALAASSGPLLLRWRPAHALTQ